MAENILNEINTIREQMGLPLLNEEQLLDVELSKLNLDPLHEGAWENVKYALSKLGRYKVGGKILGKNQTDKKYQAQIDAILDKTSNQVIKDLDRSIKKNNLEFPNNKSQLDFLNTVIEIATVYDSLVAATKLKPNDKGYLPVDAANAIIEDLRTYTQKFLDADLTAAFSVFNEEENVDENIVAEASDADTGAAKAKVAGKFADTKAAIKKGDLEAYGSERMKTLKSWRLPISLMGTGASFGVLSWVIEYFFKPETIISTSDPQTRIEIIEKTFGNIKPGEGMTQIMNRTMGLNLSPSSNPQDVVDALKTLGGGNAQTGVDIITQKGGIFVDPAAAKETLTQLVADPDGRGTTLKQVFTGTWSGTGKTIGDTLTTVSGGTLVGMLGKAITTWVTKTTVVKTSKALIAAPILKGIGVALIAGGVAAALARYKGRKSSRAQVLNDLLQYLRPVEGNENNPEVIDNDGGGNDSGNDGGNKTQGLGKSENELYVQLKKYFKDLYNFRSQVNSKSFYNKSNSNPSETPSNQIEPKDVDDLMKLMEEFEPIAEIDLKDLNLSSNELKLLIEGIKRLDIIKKIIGRINTNDKNLMKLIDAAKANPFYNMDINTLIDDIKNPAEGRKFVNDFNAAVYGTTFKNGNSIIDQLGKIQINKLQEKAVREPSKAEKRAEFTGRGSFSRENMIKNLPGYLTTLYSIFSYLIDMIKANPEGNKEQRKDFLPGQDKTSTDKAETNDSLNANNVTQPAPGSGASSGSRSLRDFGRTLEEGGRLTKEELLSLINEAEGNQTADVNDGEEYVDKAGKHYKLMMILSELLPQYASRLAREYRMKYPDARPISPKKLAEVVSLLFKAIAVIPNGKMKTFIMDPLATEAGADMATFNAVVNKLNEGEVDENRTKPADDLLKDSMNYKLLMALADSVENVKNIVYSRYNRENPNDRISSPGKMLTFIQTVLRASAAMGQARMRVYVAKSGGNLGLYSSMRKYLEDMDAGEVQDYDGFDVDNYLPNQVGNFNLNGQKPQFRKALSMKAAEIVKRSTGDNKVDEDKIRKVMIDLIKAINDKRSKSGGDVIPEA
jgi:hypothetical protein